MSQSKPLAEAREDRSATRLASDAVLVADLRALAHKWGERHDDGRPYGRLKVADDAANRIEELIGLPHAALHTPSPKEEGRRYMPGAEKIADADIATLVEAVAPTPAPATGGPFQARVQPWMMACFGPEIAADRIERNHRFLEEALELVQACGCPQAEAHQLVDYVYGRDQGDINQEVGGVMVTLAALCLANGFDMHAAGETELARVWKKIDKIRTKQAAKPRGSALPVSPSYFQSLVHPAADAEGWWVKPVWKHDGPRLLVLSVGGLQMGSIYDEAELGWSVTYDHGVEGHEIFPTGDDGYFPTREEAQAALLAAVRPKDAGAKA